MSSTIYALLKDILYEPLPSFVIAFAALIPASTKQEGLCPGLRRLWADTGSHELAACACAKPCTVAFQDAIASFILQPEHFVTAHNRQRKQNRLSEET